MPRPKRNAFGYRRPETIDPSDLVKLQREDGFQGQVMELAQLRGWLVVHLENIQTAAGSWTVGVSPDGEGFPDTLLVRDRIVFAELKTEEGRLSPKQKLWRDALRAAKQEYYLWRPRDFPLIERVLF
jgi:hypothetical protein